MYISFSILNLPFIMVLFTLNACGVKSQQSTNLISNSYNVKYILPSKKDLNFKKSIADLKSSFNYFKNISEDQNGTEYMVRLSIDSTIIFKTSESFNIDVTLDHLKITAPTLLGLQNGIYTYLNSLGFIWYFPGSAWEIKPKEKIFKPKRLRLENVSPSYPARKMFYSINVGKYKKIDSDYADWNRRNKMLPSLNGTSGHSYNQIAPRGTHFSKTPEWYALINGKRAKRGQLCVSNKALQEHSKKWINKFIHQRPKAEIISVSPNDGARWCTCNECAALGNIADQAMYFANILAREIKDRYPKKFIRLNAYNGTAVPGLRKAEPNVVVYIATKYSKYKLEELVNLWELKADHLGIREYHNTGVGESDLPQNKSRIYQHRIQSALTSNLWAYHSQNGNQWIPSGLDYFITSKLLWDPTENLVSIKRKFIEDSFGMASSIIKNFYALFEKTNVLNQALIFQLSNILKSTDSIQLSGEVKTRITHLKFYLSWLHRYYKLTNMNGEQAQGLAKSCLELVWRSRHLNILHTNGHFNRPDKYYNSLEGISKEDLNVIKSLAEKDGLITNSEIKQMFSSTDFKNDSEHKSVTISTKNIAANNNARNSRTKIEADITFKKKNLFLFIVDNDSDKVEIKIRDLKNGILRYSIFKFSDSLSLKPVITGKVENESSLTIDKNNLKDGIYRLLIDAQWLEYKFVPNKSLFWVIKRSNPGMFFGQAQNLTVYTKAIDSFKVYIRDNRANKPIVSISTVQGNPLYTAHMNSKLGQVHNIELKKGSNLEIVKLSVTKNTLVTNFFIEGVPSLVSLTGDFNVLIKNHADVINHFGNNF